jgi:hypothetical protein
MVDFLTGLVDHILKILYLGINFLEIVRLILHKNEPERQVRLLQTPDKTQKHYVDSDSVFEHLPGMFERIARDKEDQGDDSAYQTYKAEYLEENISRRNKYRHTKAHQQHNANN